MFCVFRFVFVFGLVGVLICLFVMLRVCCLVVLGLVVRLGVVFVALLGGLRVCCASLILLVWFVLLTDALLLLVVIVRVD